MVITFKLDIRLSISIFNKTIKLGTIFEQQISPHDF